MDVEIVRGAIRYSEYLKKLRYNAGCIATISTSYKCYNNDGALFSPVHVDVYRCTRALQQALLHPTLQATASDYTTITLTVSYKTLFMTIIFIIVESGCAEKRYSRNSQTRWLKRKDLIYVAVSKVNQVLDQIKAQCTEVEANLGNSYSYPCHY